jgi:hypothetical protein
VLRRGFAAEFNADATLVLESLTNPEDVISNGLDLIEEKLAQRDSEFSNARIGPRFVFGVAPYLMLRVPPSARESFRARIEEIGRANKQVEGLARAVEIAMERGKQLRWERVMHGTATPSKLMSWAREAWDESVRPNAREAFLGGEPYIERVRDRWRDYSTQFRPLLVSQYGWIRSEQVVLLFLDMLGSKLKEDVLAWFVDRADYARPILADLEKQTGPTALQARKALKHVDGVLSGGGTGDKPSKPRRGKAKAT